MKNEEFKKVGNVEGFKKMQKNSDFKKGVELFRKKHNLKPIYLETRKLIDESGENLENQKPIKFRWYKKLMSKKEIEGNESLFILSEEGVGVAKKYWVAFMAIKPPAGCLEISDPRRDEINVRALL